MAAVNTIAATFVAARASPSSSDKPPSSSSSIASLSSPSFSSPTAAANPISVSWNPHSSLRRHHRSSLLDLYGSPGPRRPLLRLPAATPLLPSISVGDRLPHASLSYLNRSGAVRSVSLSSLTAGRKAVILAVPGAFSPIRWCAGAGLSPQALVRRAAEMRAKCGGGEAVVVACVAANDVYVMRAWGEQLGAAEGRVRMLSDPDAGLAKSLGLALDMRGMVEGFGVRSDGYCIVAVNGVVRTLFLNGRHEENGGAAAASGFDDVIKVL